MQKYEQKLVAAPNVSFFSLCNAFRRGQQNTSMLAVVVRTENDNDRRPWKARFSHLYCSEFEHLV